MSRQEKRRRQRRRKAQRAAAWSVLIFCELLVASAPTVFAAEVLLPLGRAFRGYKAFGVEHFVVAAVFCISYAFAHKYACNRIFEEG